MASAGRSSTGNNDFFFWFQLQKCPCCVIYWCFQKLKHSDAWIEVSSVLSFLAHCVKKLKSNLLVILLSFDWRTDSWWDVFQWFVPITRPLSVSFLLFTFFLGHNRYLYLFPSCQVGSTTDCEKFYSVDTTQTIPPFPAALVSDPLQIYKGAQLNWTKRHFWKYNSAAGLAALNLQDPWNLFLAGSDNILISFVLQAEPKYWTNPAHETRIIHNPSVIWPNLNPANIVIIVITVTIILNVIILSVIWPNLYPATCIVIILANHTHYGRRNLWALYFLSSLPLHHIEKYWGSSNRILYQLQPSQWRRL